MPFTVAHVAAVLPAVRWARRLEPSCLVIGSMSPDFEYFVRGEQVSTISHTFVGLFAWCLPATLVLTAGVACWLPIRAAVRVDPVDTLRST